MSMRALYTASTSRIPCGHTTRCIGTTLSFAIAYLLLNPSLHARAPLRDDPAAEIDALFKEYDNQNSPGAAIVVVRDGNVIFKNAYGSADLEHGFPITSGTVFHVGSVSKQFTAFSVLLLEQQGKLSLDDDVREYLPEVPDFGKVITLRHLLHHQSGLREQETLFQMSGISTADVVETAHILKLVGRQRELDFDPGENISYSNTGYVLLAQVVEKVTGVSFRKWTQEDLFARLSMKDSQFNDNAARVVRNRACPYYIDDGGDIQKGILSYFFVGSTGLQTTADDMAKWLSNSARPKVGNQTITQKMLFESGRLKSGEDPGYGYGMGVLRYRGLRVAWHSGHDAGYRALTAYVPDEKFGVAVLSNFYSIDPSSLGKKIVSIYLSDSLSPEPLKPSTPEAAEHSAEPEKPFAVDQKMLVECAGDYISEELDTTYHLLVVDGALVIRHWRNEDVRLRPKGPDLFAGDREWAETVRFLRDAQYGITGFRLTAGRVRSILFKRLAQHR
ncbi:MAG: serine hydrolase domain-containing protein [Acidobacteriota bacterium]